VWGLNYGCGGVSGLLRQGPTPPSGNIAVFRPPVHIAFLTVVSIIMIIMLVVSVVSVVGSYY